ncbi:Hypothetical_protein [Hexamita inflata]|uniref:Hypothetical_protein n=1 Tax=Hexamita inflata TaxID=28002 RepID=A0AA86N9H4_9EUKA|nr:Hypothetical protein HINF_LOCUS2920 [Hexamita inflata]
MEKLTQNKIICVELQYFYHDKERLKFQLFQSFCFELKFTFYFQEVYYLPVLFSIQVVLAYCIECKNNVQRRYEETFEYFKFSQICKVEYTDLLPISDKY